MSDAAVKTAVVKADNLSRFFIDGKRRLDVLSGVTLELYGGEVAAD